MDERKARELTKKARSLLAKGHTLSEVSDKIGLSIFKTWVIIQVRDEASK